MAVARVAAGAVLLLHLISPASAWPHFLLEHACAKGRELLFSGGPPPPIMGVTPVLDPSMLAVGADGGVEDGGTVHVGCSVVLTHNASKGPHGFQTVFVVSAGRLEGGQPCGGTGAQLACTTCGAGWLRHTTWTPTHAGKHILAVGAARSGFGTPAVSVASVTVEAVEASGDESCSAAGDVGARCCAS